MDLTDNFYLDYDPEDTIKKAVRLIKSANLTRSYTIAFSGGKNSVVLDYLAREAGLHLPLVYNLTTIDPKGTTNFVKRHGAQVKLPRKTFLQLVEERGMPSMFSRFCCKELKEQYIAPYLMTGVRRAESVKSAKRYCSFEAVFRYKKNLRTTMLHPMIYFTDFDIKYIVNTRCLECHPLYYDSQSKFYVERRLGCQGCPLQGDRGKRDYLNNTRLLYQVAKRLLIYHYNHGRCSYDAYLNMVYKLFYSNHGHDKFLQTYHGFFEHDPKQFLESYFKIKLP